MVLCILLEIIAVWLRLVGNQQHNFIILLSGQIVASLGSPVLHFSVSKLAVNWFGEKERGIVVALVQLPLFLVLAIGALVIPQTVKNLYDLDYYLFLQALAQTFVGIVGLLYFRGEPPVPPTLATKLQEPHPFFYSFKTILVNKSFIFLAAGGATLMALFTAYQVNLPYLASTLGFESIQIGTWTVTALVGAILGSIIGGGLVDRFRAYKVLLLVGSAVSVFYLLLAFFLHQNEPFQRIYPIMFFVGFTSFLPLSATIEGGANMTYPISENFSSGMIFMFRDIVVTIIGYGFNHLFHLTKDSKYLLIGMACSAALTFFGFLSVKNEFKRSEFEDKYKERLLYNNIFAQTLSSRADQSSLSSFL